ncbi:hypothetical protein Nepgr_015764 [Nepenthes gracilis]|uniref:DUF3741 domain-containing protein n=1 Tax=Nepenthes gracilis TaxID=150966 RepID=A0AAD3SLL6_NEPGR|nr:hypothetical protein Nepgr_015764 [Nepenthes gracilis]
MPSTTTPPTAFPITTSIRAPNNKTDATGGHDRITTIVSPAVSTQPTRISSVIRHGLSDALTTSHLQLLRAKVPLFPAKTPRSEGEDSHTNDPALDSVVDAGVRENATVIVMLVEDHHQLKSELCSVSSRVNETVAPLAYVPPASNQLSSLTMEGGEFKVTSATYKSLPDNAGGLPVDIIASLSNGIGHTTAAVMEQLTADEPYDSVSGDATLVGAIYSPAYDDRKLREVATLFHLQHQHVVCYYQVWVETNVAGFLVGDTWDFRTTMNTPLNGDKVETTNNVGFACKLLRQGMKQVSLHLDSPDIRTLEKIRTKDVISEDQTSCKILCLDGRKIVLGKSTNGVTTLPPSLLQLTCGSPSVQATKWQLAFITEHQLLYCWSYQYVTGNCILDMEVYEVMKFSQIKRQCSFSLVALGRRHGASEKFPFCQPFANANCLNTNKKLQESKAIDDFQGAFHPNKELLLKSIKPPASRLAKHLRDMYGTLDYHYGSGQSMTSRALKHYIQARRCQSDKAASGKTHISFSQAHWYGFRESKLGVVVEEAERPKKSNSEALNCLPMYDPPICWKEGLTASFWYGEI